MRITAAYSGNSHQAIQPQRQILRHRTLVRSWARTRNRGGARRAWEEVRRRFRNGTQPVQGGHSPDSTFRIRDVALLLVAVGFA